MSTNKRRRATLADYRERVGRVQEWIVDEDPTFQTAIERIVDCFGVGRRQAIRYWVAAREELLDERERYLRRAGYQASGRHGWYVSWAMR